VADGGSNAVSVIDAAAGKVTGTISDSGDPVSVALTPDGSELWVGGLTSGIVSVFDTSNDSLVGTFNVGYGGEANAGDGDEPTGIVLTTTPAQSPPRRDNSKKRGARAKVKCVRPGDRGPGSRGVRGRVSRGHRPEGRSGRRGAARPAWVDSAELASQIYEISEQRHPAGLH
jgi:YVTN family beta-propeller protein